MTSPSTKAHSITEAKEDLGFKSGWVILHLNNNTQIKWSLMGKYPKLYQAQDISAL